MNAPRALRVVLLLSLSAAPLNAQFGNEWLEYVRDDARLVAAASVGAADVEEKDYATADFDRDGWVDLVCVRKEPNHTTGMRANVLFMNESGVLVDRTLEYASAADVSGDLGFLTPTNDRDVAVADVDMDGWPDIVTATTLSPGEAKHVSHPRVYLNLGLDGTGAWQGLRCEDARIPQLLLRGGTPGWPRFTTVAAGDVTGDGYPDLYFGDNDDAAQFGGGDMNDRLLVNDGTGVFTDQTDTAFPLGEVSEFYTTGACMLDLNEDGFLDVARNRGFNQPVSIAYNDASGSGVFTSFSEPYASLSYCIGFGDLNRDGRKDMVVSNNDSDVYLFNLGVSGGAASFGFPQHFEYLTGGDDGFGADSYVVDLDGDGFRDVVICDYDPQLPGCDRRTHIYHNLGGAVGAAVTLREEAEQDLGGWRGAVGFLQMDLRGTHDAGILDLDRDGDMDIVLGRCSGTFVWLNQTDPVATYCTAGTSASGCVASMSTSGTPSVTLGTGFTLTTTEAEGGVNGLFFFGSNGRQANPWGSGTSFQCVVPPVARDAVRTAAGTSGLCDGVFTSDLNVRWTAKPAQNPGAGAVTQAQTWYRDPNNTSNQTTSLSDAVEFTVQP